MNKKSWVGLLSGLLLGISGAANAAFIDHGNYTSITELNVDVYDVYAFRNMTQQEVIDQVAQMGDGWFFASSFDLIPIFSLLNEEQYLDTVKDMLGSVESFWSPGRYNTGGRIADAWPDYFPHPGAWTWGFGNAVMTGWDDNGLPVYGWSSYSMGSDIANSRLSEEGAWVIRIVPEPVPVPGAMILFASGIAGLAGARLKRNGSRA